MLRVLTLQVAKKLGDEMPVEGSLRKVAGASKVSVSAIQSELQDLSASCAQLQRLLKSLSLSGLDPFVEVGRASAHRLLHSVIRRRHVGHQS